MKNAAYQKKSAILLVFLVKLLSKLHVKKYVIVKCMNIF